MKPSKAADTATILLGLIAMVATILGVIAIFSRYVLSTSITASDEIVTYLIVWGMLIAFGVGEFSNQHLKATIFLEKMPVAYQKALIRFAMVLGVIFAAAIVYFGIEVAWQRHVFNEVSPTMLQFPQWIARASVPVGFLLVLAGLLHNLKDKGIEDINHD